MLGIHGLDPLGLVHTIFGLVSVLLGLAVVLMPKGTAAHRRTGQYYAFNMLMLNATALAIYDLTGRLGGFHVLALISLATIAAGLVPVWTRRPAAGWLDLHARFMAWSYAGVVGAFVTEIVHRIPGQKSGALTLGTSVAVMSVAAVIIHTRVRRLIVRIRDASETAVAAQ